MVAAWTAPAQAALTSLFSFDENGGTTAANSAGAPAGTLYTSRADALLPQWVPGQFGSALQFASDMPNANTANAVNTTPNGFPNSSVGGGIMTGSISIWINEDPTTTFYGAIFAARQGNQQFQFNTDTKADRSTFEANRLDFYIRESGSTKHSFWYGGIPTTTWRDSNWHNIVLTWDVDVGAKLFVDGVDNSASFTQTNDNLASTDTLTAWTAASPMTIGAFPSSGAGTASNGLTASLDDVAVWNAPLPDAQAMAVYNLGTSALTYDLKNVQVLFTAYDNPAHPSGATKDGRIWSYATGLAGTPGTLLGNTVAFDGSGNGVQSTLPAYWTGVGSTAWNTAAASNWTDTGGSPIIYSNGLDVAFGDSATGTTVDISTANVTPTSLVFFNDTKNFTVQGSMGIAGSIGLMKLGAAP